MSPKVRFEVLIESHHDEIYRYLWRLLNSAGHSDSATEAQDLAQEVFLRAYRAYKRLRPDSNQRAWLYRIATNCAYNALKRNQRRSQYHAPLNEDVHPTPPDAEGAPEYQVSIRETLEAIRQSIQNLPPKQGAAVVLRHVQGLSYPEIAQALDCSEDSARANVYQGLRRLRREVGQEL